MTAFAPRFLPDEEAMLSMGQQLARAILRSELAASRGFQINLIGDLGAGKTTLVRGVLRGLGYAGRVKSPTYPLLETYAVDDLVVAHFDLYRLESPDAFTEAGFEEYFSGPGLRFIEWPNRAGARLPHADWCVRLVEGPQEAGGRVLSVDALTPAGITLQECLSS